MRVDITFAVADLPHESGGCVAQVEGYTRGSGSLDEFLHSFLSQVHGVAFRRTGEVDGCFVQGDLPSGAAHEGERFLGAHCHAQCIGVRHADILGSYPDHPAQDKESVLARFKHPAQPVDTGLNVSRPHALVKGGNEIVVVLSGSVMVERPFHETFEVVQLDGFLVDIRRE